MVITWRAILTSMLTAPVAFGFPAPTTPAEILFFTALGFDVVAGTSATGAAVSTGNATVVGVDVIGGAVTTGGGAVVTGTVVGADVVGAAVDGGTMKGTISAVCAEAGRLSPVRQVSPRSPNAPRRRRDLERAAMRRGDG